jgi:hypothetical protein
MEDRGPMGIGELVKAPEPNPAVRRRQELRESIRTKRLEIREIQTKRALRELKESSSLDIDWVSPWVDMLNRMQDDGGGWLPISSPSSRRQGSNFPLWQSEQQHGLIRDMSRIVAQTNNHAIGMLNGLTSFVIGEEMKLQVTDGPGCPTGLAKKVANFFEGWSDANLWPEKQWEIFERTREDGEAFVRIFEGDDWPELRFVWPEQVTRPPGAPEEFNYGILNAPGDAEKAVKYWVADPFNPARGDEVNATDMLHIKVNVRSGIKRGVPDFSFATKDTLEAAARLTRNMGEGSAAREAVAWIQQHATGSAGEIAQWVAANADVQAKRQYGRGAQYENIQVDKPGTVYNVPAGLQFAGMPVNTGTPAHVQVVQVLLQSAGVRWNAPIWLISGDASQMGAYTSSLVAESPFVRSVKKGQGFYRRRYIMILRMVLEWAELMGLVPAGSCRFVKLELTPPTVEVRKKLEDAQVDQIYSTMGVKSPQRISREQGWEYEKDVQEINAHLDQLGDLNVPLPIPTDPEVKNPIPPATGPGATPPATPAANGG